MRALDEIDFKITRVMERDTEVPYDILADELGVSLTTVYNRMRRLKRMGVIKRITAEIDYEKLGYGIRALVGVSVLPSLKAEALTRFKRLDQIRVIYETTGRYDYLIEVLARQTDDLGNLLTEKMGKIDGVQRTETMMIISLE